MATKRGRILRSERAWGQSLLMRLARIVLENPESGISNHGPEGTPAASLHHKTPRWSWAIAGVFAFAAAAVSFVHFRERQPERQVLRTAILPPEKSTFTAGGNSGPMALSPDGKRIVFAATGEDGKSQLWIRPLDATPAQPIPGSAGGTFPFWSPDNRYVAFFTGGRLKKIDTAGGPAGYAGGGIESAGRCVEHERHHRLCSQ